MSKRFALMAAFVLGAVVLLSYQPSFRIGFYLDDYYNIERAGRIEWADALRQLFDPRAQTLWYRPLQGLQFFIEYQILGGNSNAYHLVSIVYHAINVLLLYVLAWRVSKRWLVGFVTALFYATFSVYISGVVWIGIVEPLLGVFYLASILCWWLYLENPQGRYYILALVTLILALMAKQTALTLPIIFFLMDRLMLRHAISFADLVRRYIPFGITAAAFAFLQYIAPSTSVFTGTFGWKLGASMLSILWEYMTLLFVPWGLFPSIDLNPPTVGNILTYAWSALVLILIGVVTWRTKSRLLLVLSIFTFITLVPVLPFPFLEHRYAYLPIISIAVILGLVFMQLYGRWGQRAHFSIGASFVCAVIVFGNGWALNESVASAADWARTLRVPYRDIERQNPTFPKDTLLYFIDPITPTEGGLSGMFFLRYGKDITVRNWTQYAGLREHNAAFVYYFDQERRPRQIAVDKNAPMQSSPLAPVSFGSVIVLDGYEVAQATIKRGTPIVLIVYWRARETMERDYSVFVHLVAPDGKIVAQFDGMPRKGQAPTSMWKPGLLMADALMLATDQVTPNPGYRLQFGWYDAATQQRLSIVDANGQPAGDALTIQTLSVIE